MNKPDSEEKVQPFCICFAGVVGTSKSPVANYLSYKMKLPVFSHDLIRTEVLEDMLKPDKFEYERRRDARLRDILNKKLSFIYDASIDRNWNTLRSELITAEYRFFVISFDLTREFLLQLYKAKGYEESAGRVDQLLNEHEQFVSLFAQDIGLSISDAIFLDRLDQSLKAATDWEQGITQQSNN